MPPPRWTTPTQLAFLQSQVDSYLETRKNKRYHKFWKKIDCKWFKKWPEEGLSEEVDLRTPEGVAQFAHVAAKVGEQKAKLKAWFRNNTGHKGRRVSKNKTIITIGVGSAQKHRRLRLHEMYSRMVYKNQIQSIVANKIRDVKPSQKGTLPLITSAIKEAWEAESDDVKQAVLDAVANQPAPVKGRGVIKKTPKAYAKIIDKIPDILDQFFTELAEMTGWAFDVICGGPEPQNGGRVRVIGFHEGENNIGLSFSEANPEYEEKVLGAYGNYLKSVFPVSVCNARALQPGDEGDDSNNDDDNDDGDGDADDKESDSDSSDEEDPPGWWVGPAMKPPGAASVAGTCETEEETSANEDSRPSSPLGASGSGEDTPVDIHTELDPSPGEPLSGAPGSEERAPITSPTEDLSQPGSSLVRTAAAWCYDPLLLIHHTSVT
ncbi:hypothetical protein BD779DRAFT_1679943 [Infundibulicybe gibba]|nr:hypothetical protein BD779DRAFT_1679943 [Infundibulicybe gibba]